MDGCLELGLYSFAETTVNPATGERANTARRLRDLLEEIVLADEVGLDVYGVGEHHRPDFAVSAPAVVLAAAAARTSRIRLTSAVSVLSSDDPVRVFQEFSTLDLLSNGRAEIMAGRGSFIESFPLFGYDLADYDALFEEKLGLLLALRANERVTWRGEYRTEIRNQPVYPRPLQDPLPVWIAIGGTPQSAARAGMLGLPLAIAIIGGEPARFTPFVEIYRDAWARGGHDPALARVSINSHGFLAETEQEAADVFWPRYADAMGRIGRERGWPPPTRAHFDRERSPHGALLLGSPQQVVDKVLYEHELFRMDRFLLQLSVGTMPHVQMLRAIELYGTVVAPAVRKALT
jgi:probable LLM family oxidoreductase